MAEQQQQLMRVLSGVQPTGNLHLGNYLGAIKNWVSLQKEYKCLFCVVDLHAITVPQDPEELRCNIRTAVATYIACGIDPEKSVIFPQSAVYAHTELAWILNCITPLGWLERMTQFKEKSGKNKERASTGLFVYPILMAADILAYKATHVPVGEDQKQHLELARDIAEAFNRRYKVKFFPIPKPLILEYSARIMSLRDGKKKMSKSDESDYSRINLADDSDMIAKKIKKATTDSNPEISYDPESRPETANLLNIYSSLSEVPMAECVERLKGSGFALLKKELTEILNATIKPIAAEINRLNSDPAQLDLILRTGAEKAAEIADGNIKKVKELVGFLE